MKQGNLVSLLYVVSWFLVLIVAFLARIDSPVLRVAAKPLGALIFLCGMLLFAWAVACLGTGFLGDVEPVSGTLVTRGPYRFVRHPLYLGTVIGTIGLVIGLCSVLGMAAVLLLFVPATVYRARLEEEAMARKFGEEWDAYASKTGFMLPAVR